MLVAGARVRRGAATVPSHKACHELFSSLRSLWSEDMTLVMNFLQFAFSGCKERFLAGETKIIGAMKLDPFSCR